MSNLSILQYRFAAGSVDKFCSSEAVTKPRELLEEKRKSLGLPHNSFNIDAQGQLNYSDFFESINSKYISKIEKWMQIVRLRADLFSKDPSTQVGALILDHNMLDVGYGYNGFVRGCNENGMSFERPLKYELTLHAEENALLFCQNRQSIDGGVMVVTHRPCARCLRMACQLGIKGVFYGDDALFNRFSDEAKIACDLLFLSTDLQFVQKL